MAWQKAIAQDVAATMYSGGEPTAPTGALSATISKDGGAFGAIAGTVTQIGASPCVLLALTTADTNCDTGVIKVVDAGAAADDRYIEFVTEASWTATKAGHIDGAITSRAPAAEYDTEMARLDVAVSTRSTLTAAQVWEYGTRTLSAFGTLVANIWNALCATYNTPDTMGAALNAAQASGNITLSAQSTDITVDAGDVISGSGAISVVRDDDNSLQITWADHVITGYSIYLTVRPSEYSEATDDTDAVFQVKATLTTPASGVFTFAIGKAQTDECDVERNYRYDVQAISAAGAITTLLKGQFKATGDVTRRTSV